MTSWNVNKYLFWFRFFLQVAAKLLPYKIRLCQCPEPYPCVLHQLAQTVATHPDLEAISCIMTCMSQNRQLTIADWLIYSICLEAENKFITINNNKTIITMQLRPQSFMKMMTRWHSNRSRPHPRLRPQIFTTGWPRPPQMAKFEIINNLHFVFIFPNYYFFHFSMILKSLKLYLTKQFCLEQKMFPSSQASAS